MTKKEKAVDNYIREKHTQEECIGFIDGYEKSQEDSSIEFAEWCACEFWIFKVYDDCWVNYGGVDLRKLKSQELFLEYKQLNKQD